MKRLIKFLLEFFLFFLLKSAFWFRYKVTVTGLDRLNEANQSKPGGILFLPNHCTVFIDAAMISLALWPKYRTRAMIVEYMYYLPVVHWVMKTLEALPVPNFTSSSNSLKKRNIEKAMQSISHGLRQKQHFLIFPAGRTKQTAIEAIDGASAAHRLVQETPEANVVLVRIKGLWGSSFSRAFTGKAPALWPTLFHGIKAVMKNFLFFTPRREVQIEFELPSADFPWKAGKLEFNKYLENWYNKPDGLIAQKAPLPGDSLILVPYTRWSNEIPALWEPEKNKEEGWSIEKVSESVQQKVRQKIVTLTGVDPALVQPKMLLTTDLGMDSLDLAEMMAFLEEEFDIQVSNVEELTTVGKVMAVATRQVTVQESAEEEQDLSKWHIPLSNHRTQIAPGETLPEVFLNSCHRLDRQVACSDLASGTLTYKQLKQRVLGLADYLRKEPGSYIGIMLPASIAASASILAVQLAGKVPVMLNWTVGSRHLTAAAQATQMKTILTSWSFLERLQNVELTGIEEQLVMLEDLRRKISVVSKFKVALLSMLKPQWALRLFGASPCSADDPAVILFTSGTENLPKGVPLSHRNLLSNQRSILKALEICSNDVIFGTLPPFHSFGFTLSLIGLFAGVRVAYSPDPTNGKRIAEGFARWGATIICGPPTFMKAILKSGTPEQLASLRYCIVGAEKLSQDLVHMMEALGKSHCLLEAYGITECAPGLTLTRAGQPRKGVGKPFPDVDICIVDPSSYTPLPQGVQGLILARGPNVFAGYLDLPDNDPFVTLDGAQWYITGDLGSLDEEGHLTLSGRLKRFIKIGGEMISLLSIEHALAVLTPSSEEGPTLAIDAEELPGEKPKITLYCTFPITLEEANKALKEAGFSNLVRISTVREISSIPLMGSGKIDYRKLRGD